MSRNLRTIARRTGLLAGLLALLTLAAPATAPAAAAPAEAAPATPAGGLVDLNSATRAELLALPIPPEIVDRIIDYRTYVSYFHSVYDLMDIDGMTAALLARLKPLVATKPPPPADAAIERLEASYRQVQRFLGQEGANEGLVDEYIDQIREPVNLNHLDLFDLMGYQNVSPVDATAILKARKRLGGFEDARQLRQAEGLRYWAYRNLRDFVVYSDEPGPGTVGREMRGSYEMRYYDTPYSIGDEEDLGGQILNQPGENPFMTHKVRLSLTDHMRVGLLTNRNLGEPSWHETTKGFVGLRRFGGEDAVLKNVVLGSYRVAFGQGLVMDNTDFVLYRKTGYGYNKRPIGVRGDLSRSQEYALFGAAAEARVGNLLGTFFVSSDRKDAILNPDGTLNSYIRLYPRPAASWLDGSLVKLDAMQEDIFGGNVKYMLGTGTYVGFTGYEATYDRGWRADVNTLVAATELLEPRDSEIYQGYTSVFIKPDSSRTTYDFRRVYGAEFQTVWRNLALQGEYAWLQDPRRGFLGGDLGDAWIVNGYGQWDNLNLLAIYRDYDVGFDNPYNRAFSNDTRYEQTLLDAYYRLNDDRFTYLSLFTPQPKPERGLFMDMRYRLSRQFTLTGVQYDQWERKADGMDMRRYTIRAEYQPIFNIRLRLRQRFSSRSEQLPEDVRRFRSWETRWELHALLSNYSRLKFMYMTSNVEFPPRQRLSYPPEAGDLLSGVGTAAMPAHAFQAAYEHNVTDWIRLIASTEIYDGFLWNFEGNEFVLLDGNGYRNWFKVESRMGQRLLMQLKVTRDHNLPLTYLDLRDYGAPLGLEPEGTYVPRDQTTFRLQMDYTF